MSGLPFNFGPLYRHVALPTIAASPDGRPWDTTPGSHRWLGARVAWEFGEDVYAGTCTGWKKRDNVLGYAIWFVCYDDGDTEVFDVAHMRYSMRLHNERFANTGRAPRRSPTSQKSRAEAAAVANSPRRSQGVLSTASRASRLSAEQELLPFPVLISPQRLQQGPLRAAATPGATVQSRKRKWLEPTHERTPPASEAAAAVAEAAVAAAATVPAKAATAAAAAAAQATAPAAAEAAEVAAIEAPVAEASTTTTTSADVVAEAIEVAEAANLEVPLGCSRSCSLEL